MRQGGRGGVLDKWRIRSDNRKWRCDGTKEADMVREMTGMAVFGPRLMFGGGDWYYGYLGTQLKGKEV